MASSATAVGAFAIRPMTVGAEIIGLAQGIEQDSQVAAALRAAWIEHGILLDDYPLAPRNSLRYTMGMTKAPTLRQFLAAFPTEEACLDHLMANRFGHEHECGKCGRFAKFHRVTNRRSYACHWCGHQVFPCAGSPFDRTRTPLRDWFHVMFLFVTTRNGVAAKTVQRQLGVTYKTAWRMCHEIREYMGQVDGDPPLGGFSKVVEVDETWIGGEVEGKGIGFKGNKTTVFGMKERGGDVITRVVPNRRRSTLLPLVLKNVKPHTEIHTDEAGAYQGLGGLNGYWHKSVNHAAEEYVRGNVTVNGIEGFWSSLKRGINGTHIHVSVKHLPKYLGEFEYRHNRRHQPHLMLDELMTSFAR